MRITPGRRGDRRHRMSAAGQQRRSCACKRASASPQKADHRASIDRLCCANKRRSPNLLITAAVDHPSRSLDRASMTAYARGCAKTCAFNLRVESSSQFGQSENQKCWLQPSEEGNRENGSTRSWLAHVFTRAGPHCGHPPYRAVFNPSASSAREPGSGRGVAFRGWRAAVSFSQR